MENNAMNKIIQFGEEVPGYNIRVLNEREIRAAAGLWFLATFISIIIVINTANFVPIKYVSTIFLIDFAIRVFINPRFSPSLIIGRLIVSKQTPEYVGSPQKKFAWLIGVILSGTMFVLLVVVNAYSPITGLICLICLIFLFFESVFGICLGCKFYPLFFKNKVQYCPGEVCDVRSRQEIQKTSGTQLTVVLGFALLITLLISFSNSYYGKKPYNLFGTHSTAKTK
jgi:Domain of unknown function (DUF4395)